jgi:hypothetical protein
VSRSTRSITAAPSRHSTTSLPMGSSSARRCTLQPWPRRSRLCMYLEQATFSGHRRPWTRIARYDGGMRAALNAAAFCCHWRERRKSPHTGAPTQSHRSANAIANVLGGKPGRARPPSSQTKGTRFTISRSRQTSTRPAPCRAGPHALDC